MNAVDRRANLFDERIAAGYDASTDISAPEFVDPVVDFLAGQTWSLFGWQPFYFPNSV